MRPASSAHRAGRGMMHKALELAPLPWFIDDDQQGIYGKDTISICHSGDPECATPPIVCVVYRGYEDGPSRTLADFICSKINSSSADNVYHSQFAPLDHVQIDDDTSIVATVIGLTFQSADRLQVGVSWIANGVSQEGWFDEIRLRRVP